MRESLDSRPGKARLVLPQAGDPTYAAGLPPLLQTAFRPFFLLAALWGGLAIPIWLGLLGGMGNRSALLGTGWHSHEMVVGYAAAVLAGFFLTAARVWTKRPTLHGASLAWLIGLWLAGRLAWAPVWPMPEVVGALLDLAFLGLLAFGMGRAIFGARSKRNYGFVALIGLLAAADLALHFGPAEVAARATTLSLDAVLAILVIFGARVVPMFTRNALPEANVRPTPWADQAVLPAMILLLGTDLLDSSALGGLAALFAGSVIWARTMRWGARATWRHPIVWVLHVGYGWLATGFILRGAAAFLPGLASSVGTHALTAGALGTMTLGMMARVSLGHSGRPLKVPTVVSFAFVLITLGALLRVGTPVFAPQALGSALHWAGGLWSLALLIFAVRYYPILTSPRADGRPG